MVTVVVVAVQITYLNSFLVRLIRTGLGPHAPRGGITTEHTSFRWPQFLEPKETDEYQAPYGHTI